MQPVSLGLRIAQLVLSVCVLGLTAYLINVAMNAESCGVDYFGDAVCEVIPVNFPGLDFTIFTTAWTLLASIYFLMAACEKGLPLAAFHPGALLGLDILTAIFWLVSWAVLAWLTTVFFAFTSSVLYGIIIAATVLSAAIWVLFVVSTVLSGLAVGRLGRPRLNAGFSTATTPTAAYPTHTPVASPAPVTQPEPAAAKYSEVPPSPIQYATAPQQYHNAAPQMAQTTQTTHQYSQQPPRQGASEMDSSQINQHY